MLTTSFRWPVAEPMPGKIFAPYAMNAIPEKHAGINCANNAAPDNLMGYAD